MTKDFLAGIGAGFLALSIISIIISAVSTSSQESICSKQNWSGAACQCRQLLYGDKK